MAVHCSNWRSAKIAVAVAVLAGLLGTPASAAVLLQHSGNTDPTTEGFGNFASSFGPAPGAWQMSGPSCYDYYEYLLSSAQTAALGSANEWTLTARFNNFAAPDAGIPWGTYVRLLLNNTAFDLALFSNGTGDQILSLDTPKSMLQITRSMALVPSLLR